MPDISVQRGPVRLVAREISELFLGREERWRSIFSYERAGGVVFTAVLGSSIAHLPYRDPEDGRWIGLGDGEHLGRAVNAASISEPLGLSHTTVRRHAAGLERQGYFERRSRGFVVSSKFFAGFAAIDAARHDALALTASLQRLAEGGFVPAARALDAGIDRAPPGVIERVVVNCNLRILETFTERYGDVTGGMVASVITAFNVRHVTLNPELARQYAAEGAVPPDELRQPVAARAVAKALDLPFETVRRRINGLIDGGFVVRCDDGFVVPSAALTSEGHLRHIRRNYDHVEHMANVLTGLATDARRRS